MFRVHVFQEDVRRYLLIDTASYARKRESIFLNIAFKISRISITFLFLGLQSSSPVIHNVTFFYYIL